MLYIWYKVIPHQIIWPLTHQIGILIFNKLQNSPVFDKLCKTDYSQIGYLFKVYSSVIDKSTFYSLGYSEF